MPESFDKPLDKRARKLKKARFDSEVSGIASERIARFTGTPQFLIYLTVFVIVWIAWNTLAPDHLQFDSAALGFTALTLMLSLQASYSAPLILLAQNRQDDRDRVTAQRDRQVAAQNLADTEYLTREIASLRLGLGEVATRDFIRSELREVLENIEYNRDAIARRDAVIAQLEERIAQLEETHRK
ncbi:DUF1003 domain-containing protein [Arcanobacterium hippocoleae]|uniref:Membrane protein n=1 Tax=Arcanobacterium hippocoleae TaxID=149017 RepID=A0ABU1SZY4_9ACTO|nr:DUF1003 domain-containing protein [Arcanobacterium hippocoleae]MDR6938650.1 putative membrane protein [Arcanobacterium hippocoleae]